MKGCALSGNRNPADAVNVLALKRQLNVAFGSNGGVASSLQS